ncbi:MAG: hypothetical protein V4750_02775 [Pseudomonadota bacterium]
MPAPSFTYTLTNGTTADATQVQQNFTDILNGVTDGTKDLSINALTLAGALTANGNVTLGNASGDDITVTGSLASTIPIKTTNSYDIGSSTLGLRAAYFGANSQTVNIKGSASMSATWTLTLPVTAGTANYLMTTNGSGVSAWTSWTDSAFAATTSAAGTVTREVLSAEQDIGTLAWAAGVAPSGTISKRYRWQRIGNQVTLWYRVEASVAGTAVTELDFDLPSDCPTPADMTNQGTSEFYAAGPAVASPSASTNPSKTVLYKTGGSPAYIFNIYPGAAIALTSIYGSITYYTA